MKYVYIYDISNGKIVAQTLENANYAKVQGNFQFATDYILSDIYLMDNQIFNWQINLETKTLERKPGLFLS